MPRSGVLFVSEERRAALCDELRGARHVVIHAPAAKGGQVRAAIDEALEGALAQKGALPPAVELDASPRRAIGDQIFRVRALGARGLAIALPRLEAAADGGLLGDSDSAALAAWIEAAREAPLLLLADERDRQVRLWSPRPLEDLVADAAPESGEIATPRAATESGEIATPRAATAPANDAATPARQAADALFAELARAISEEADAREGAAEAAPDGVAPAPACAEVASPLIEVFATPAAVTLAPAAAPAVKSPSRRAAAAPPAESPRPATAPPADAADRVLHAAEWRSFAVDLDDARGPKPVSAVERLFSTRYMPLVGAAARGEVDAAVATVIDEWRTDFEHSYKDGFASLRVTGKRPPMVLDAPELAAKIARLNGARAVKLLLVDAMRFDLGERVAARLATLSAGRAVCVDRALLWAALPTRTPTQIALLARGAEGLRDPDLPSDGEPDVARGRAVSTLRRERIGAREIMKVDLVEARMRTAGPGLDERLDAVAVEVADVIARYMESLPARTLLYVFGDHGFRLPVSADSHSSAAATQGGASPEEVLVPAHAWLVGEMH